MKKLFPFICLIFQAVSSYGQNVHEVHVDFTCYDFDIITANGLSKVVTTSPEGIYLYGEHGPALPFFLVNVLVANNDEFSGVDYVVADEVFANQVKIATLPDPEPVSQVVAHQASLPYQGETYPAERVLYTGTQIVDGYKILNFLVSPFLYSPSGEILSYSPCITMTVNTSGQLLLSGQAGAKGFIGKNMRKDVARIVANPGELEILYPTQNQILLETNALSDSDSYDYLIVTNSDLKPLYEQLAAWKTVKGVRTAILTTEEIASQYTGSNTSIKIKKAIYDYYQNKGIRYALLGGDVDVIPAVECYVAVDTRTDGPYVPTDLFYACFDNDFEWDANHDGIIGMYNVDNADMSPDIILSRVSISREEELEPYLTRIINYEMQPNTENWTDNILMCGLHINNIENDASQSVISSYNLNIKPNWDGDLYLLFNDTTSHPDGAAYDVTRDNMQEQFGKGYTFIDVTTHGGNERWKVETGNPYTDSRSSILVNQGNSVITTMACFTNAFDRLDACLGESFIRNPNSGILAYIGNTREGWYPTEIGYIGNLYHSLLDENNESRCLGLALRKVRINFAGSLSSMVRRWVLVSLNHLGDPEMPVFCSLPQQFSSVNFSYSGATLSLQTGVDGCRICISSADDNGGSYYDVVEDVNSISRSGLNGEYYVCVTHPGYIPYVAKISNLPYVQNETITYDSFVRSSLIEIGSDVTTLKTEGPVVVEKSLTAKSPHNKVVVKNDLKVKKGAVLKINTSN